MKKVCLSFLIIALAAFPLYAQVTPAGAVSAYKDGLDKISAGDAEGAKNAFKQAISVDRFFPEPYLELSKLYAAENSKQDAVELLSAFAGAAVRLQAEVPKLLSENDPVRPGGAPSAPFNHFDAQFTEKTDSIPAIVNMVFALCVQQRFETAFGSAAAEAGSLLDPLSVEDLEIAKKINDLKNQVTLTPENYIMSGASGSALIDMCSVFGAVRREYAAGNYTAITDAFEELRSDFKQAPYFNYIAGLSCCMKNDTAKAVEYFRGELAVSPKNANAFFACAYLFLKDGRRDDAETLARKFLEASPGSVAALHILAYSCMKNNDIDSAEKYAGSILKSDPAYGWAYLFLGDCARIRDKDMKTALGHYRKFLEIQPSSQVSPIVRIFTDVNSADPYGTGMKEDIIIQKKVKMLPDGATVDITEKIRGRIVEETNAVITFAAADNRLLRISTTAIDESGMQKNVETPAVPLVEKFFAGPGAFSMLDTGKALELTAQFAQDLKDKKIRAWEYPVLTSLLRQSLCITYAHGDTAKKGWLDDMMLLSGYSRISGNDWTEGRTAEFVAAKNTVADADTDTAIAKLEKLRGPKFISAELPLSLGMLYYENGDFQKAVSFFEEGLKFNPSDTVQGFVKDMIGAAKENKPCTACRGLGMLKCLSCGGAGIIKCPDCFGSGFVAPAKIGIIDGSGQKVPCKTCKGLKFAPHKPCNGRGWTACKKCANKTKKVVPIATCRACGGSGIAGEYVLEICRDCAGLGVTGK